MTQEDGRHPAARLATLPLTSSHMQDVGNLISLTWKLGDLDFHLDDPGRSPDIQGADEVGAVLIYVYLVVRIWQLSRRIFYQAWRNLLIQNWSYLQIFY